MLKSKFKKNMAGLTMIELIVAIGIFGLVISVVIGIFVLAVVSQRRVIAVRNANDNVRFAIEVISREIRTGKDFNSAQGQLSFVNAKGESVVYRLASNRIEKSSDGGVNYLAVTGSEITVTYLNFYLDGQTTLDERQPRVSVAIGADSKVGSQNINLKVHTSISSRFLQN